MMDIMKYILYANLAGPQCTDTWSNITLDVSVKVFFLDDINIKSID